MEDVIIATLTGTIAARVGVQDTLDFEKPEEI
jgi:hypothetical protein